MVDPPVHCWRQPSASPLLLTCEHASCALPPAYAGLGLMAQHLEDHIGWDIGAAAVARQLSSRFSAPLVESAWSRLLIDCNRGLSDFDLIAVETHGVDVPGNRGVDEDERQRRIASFYEPYHDAIDGLLASRGDTRLLLSVHSFTAETRGDCRRFDVGVLYDDYLEEAESLICGLRAQGFDSRHNEPYSAFEGLIFSARSHGRRHGVPYLEIEVNNSLIRGAADAKVVADRVSIPLRNLLDRLAGRG